MILTVTANAALDVTYTVPSLIPRGSHRVSTVSQHAGGKGINVSAALAALDRDSVLAGAAGGRTGQQIRLDLDERALTHRLTESEGESRRTVNVVDLNTGDATIFNERGTQQSSSVWSFLVRDVVELIQESAATVVVVSGSMPPGFPEDGYAQLVRVAHDNGARVVLDADGPLLAAGVVAGPDIVKPNAAEITNATGECDLVQGAVALRALGARDVVISVGADGVLFLPSAGPGWRGRLATPLVGNPTGAGDAMVAALAASLAEGWSAQQTIRAAVAWSAAAVLQPFAGWVDPRDVSRLESHVLLEEIL